MELNDIRTLSLLEALEGEAYPSQRYLSKRLNISLGLVNLFIKRLSQQGYFEINAISKNKVRYILTPKGISTKHKLTHEYFKYSFRYYREKRNKTQEFLNKLEKEGVNKIAILGVNDLAEIIYLSLKETHISTVAILDIHTIGQKFFEYTIEDPSLFDYNLIDKVILTTIDNREFTSKINNILNKNGNKLIHYWSCDEMFAGSTP